ncbi:gamma-aminobutyric acid type B receptor subunit 2-like [Amphiura filiformis]|uniref:gamma-aminobutyric acid type B receptor subunit 2-like n=1 Tax=Amphiura filiformis TaxID=82378 RepID=UPI003B2131FB
MMNAGYVWITYDWYGPRWWADFNDDIECTVEEMDEAILSTTCITVDRAFFSTKNGPTISGSTPQELISELQERMEWEVNQQYTWNVYAPFGYDAAWAIALMLNRTIEILKTKVFVDGKTRRLEDFNYDDWEMARMFFDLLKLTDFEGMSGHIAFKGGDRVGGGSIRQIEGNSRRTVAYYLVEEDRIQWIDKIEWKGGNIPTDHTAMIRLYKGITLFSYIIICITAGIGILVAGFFLGFNLKFRTQRTVKMSSPNLNNFIIVGNILIYLSVIVGGLDNNIVSFRTLEAACQMRAWLLSTGFVLAFGSMFSKTWRVYRVAALKTPKRKVITDNHLFIMVLVLFCVDVLVLTLWQVLDPIYVEVIDINEERNPDIANQRIVTYIEQCTSDNSVYWIVPLYGYKGLLLIFGTFLAWETRKVTIAALNDSKLIGICVYNTVVLCIVGVSVSYLITNDTEALFIFTSCITIFCATLTLVVLFVPKVISVYKFPEGEPTTTMKRGATSGLNKTPGSSENTMNDINNLQTRVLELEEELNSSKKKSISTMNGCGMWCGGVVYKCCSSSASVDEDVVVVEKQGMDNHAMITETNTI